MNQAEAIFEVKGYPTQEDIENMPVQVQQHYTNSNVVL